jgi:regulator of protease activity HflC (stomatin/prohibitin superfamily)
MIRKNLAQAKAMADTQPGVVTAERSVQIASFTADATVKTAQGQAKAKEVNATADAMVLKTVGSAEGEKILAVGTSEAEVIKKKTAAMDPEKYAMVEVARALAGSGFKLVPDIIASGGGNGADNGGGNSLVNILLASVIRDNGRKGEQK